MARPDDSTRAMQDSIAALMRRSLQSMFRYLKENELSMSQIGALFQINRGHGHVSALGESLGVSIAAASQMIERLVQQGLIVRLEDPEDRRARPLVLTEKGRRILKGSLQARQGWLEHLAASLSPTEREQVASALRLLLERTEQLEDEPEPAG